MKEEPAHPGTFIREKVFPHDMTVTAAAELLNIGRPALSRVLNGKASLSLELAERIQIVFGFPAEELLKMQASYSAEISKNSNAQSPVGSYVPPFLQVRARQIERWASENTEARRRLAVLLRLLVNSTGSGLGKVDFPGNDDAERPGWDGVVEADRATPWIPQGLFGLGVRLRRRYKAQSRQRLREKNSVRAGIRTSHRNLRFRHPEKVGQKKTTGKKLAVKNVNGKDVRVFDASDLEQWMEQSIPAQIWFAHETEIPSKGVLSLEQCWKQWQADCEPALVPSLFDQALKEPKRLRRAVA